MATKSVKKTAKKASKKAETNFAKIKTTAKKVNAEVQETANYVVNDIVENGQAVRDTAVKAAEKFDLSDSVNKIKNTAEKISGQVTDTAVEVTDSFVQQGKKLTASAQEQAKAAIDKIDVAAGITAVRETAGKVNAYSLETAEEVLAEAKVAGDKWHKIAKKAITGGFKVAAKNQEIVFDALETVKKQLTKNAGRFTDIIVKK